MRSRHFIAAPEPHLVLQGGILAVEGALAEIKV